MPRGNKRIVCYIVLNSEWCSNVGWKYVSHVFDMHSFEWPFAFVRRKLVLSTRLWLNKLSIFHFIVHATDLKFISRSLVGWLVGAINASIFKCLFYYAKVKNCLGAEGIFMDLKMKMIMRIPQTATINVTRLIIQLNHKFSGALSAPRPASTSKWYIIYICIFIWVKI